jgi:hypothetical protein
MRVLNEKPLFDSAHDVFKNDHVRLRDHAKIDGILLSETGCMKDRASNRGYAPGYLEQMQAWLAKLFHERKHETEP